MNARRTGTWLGIATLVACATAACAEADPGAPAPARPAGLVAEVILPPAPAAASVLRVTVTPKSRPDSSLTLQGTLRIDARPSSAVPLPPWTLFPADQAATFVARVPVPLLEASRAGQRLVLTVAPASARAGAAAMAPAAVAIDATWDSPHE